MTIRQQLGHMKRRTLVKITSFLLASVLVLIGSTVSGYVVAYRYRTQLEYTYQRAMGDLSNYLDNINVSLQKGIYSGTASQLSSIAAQLWSESGQAKSSLSQLPTTNVDLTNINKFLSQVGDYSLSIARERINGQKVTPQERKNLESLSKNASLMSSNVANMANEISKGNLWINEVEKSIESNSSNMVATPIDNGLKTTEEAIVDYPTLIYDGPFSDSIVNAEPQLTKGKADLTVDFAKQAAAKFLSLSANVINGSSEVNGVIPGFNFTTPNGNISVSKKGGYIIYFRDPRAVGKQKISYNDAVKKAVNIADGLGFGSFKESYYITQNGVCTVNLAYLKDNIICYTDLIKIGIAMDTGEMVSIESRGFIMNHHARVVEKPKYTADDAIEVVSDVLKVRDSAIAIIPSPGGTEKLCYEFTCTGMNNENVMVYVDANTLQEDQILILLQTDGGTLTK